MASARFKAIIPKKINKAALMKEVSAEMKAAHKDVDKDFDATVRTWEHKPKFDREFESSASRIRFFTGTGDKIYGYVSEGTRPHIIRPKKAKALHFMGGYTAKTSPGTIGSKSGGSSGGEVFSKGVKHPGSEGREFPEAILKKQKRPLTNRIKSAMNRAAKKSGHAI